MKQHKVVELKNAAIHIVDHTAGVFYSTVRCLVTGCEFVRAPIQIHRSFLVPMHRSLLGFPSCFVFQININRSEKGGTQHSIVI